MQVTVFDRVSYRVTRREYTDEGFLRVPGNVARTGIQEYLARELGLDGDPNAVIRVYRPADEVFKKESLDTYIAADVTVNHPKTLVNADTYKHVAVGVVTGPGRQEGDFVQCDLIVKDKAAINAINSGKVELSAGYTAVYSKEPGVTGDGEAYDYVQRDIRINHVALVDRARAGANARIFDHNPEIQPMTHKVVLDSGKSVEVQDEATAILVTDAFERLAQKVKDAEAKAQAAQAVADKQAEDLDKARKASSPEAIGARVTEIADKQVLARKIAGDAFKCESVDSLEIMRAALAVKRPSVDWASKELAYVKAAFDMEAEKEEDEGSDKSKKVEAKDHATILSQLVQLSQDAAKAKEVTDAKPSAYAKHKSDLADAWKGAK